MKLSELVHNAGIAELKFKVVQFRFARKTIKNIFKKNILFF